MNGIHSAREARLRRNEVAAEIATQTEAEEAEAAAAAELMASDEQALDDLAQADLAVSARFADLRHRLPAGTGSATACGMADLDGDGRQDIVRASGGTAVVLTALAWMFPLHLLSSHARWVLVVAGHQRALLLAQLAGAATTALVGTLAVPRLGANGAALAMLVRAAPWREVLGTERVMPVGGDAFEAATRCIAHEGRLLVVGFASGRWGSPRMPQLVQQNYSLIGVMPGGYSHEVKRAAHAELRGGGLRVARSRTWPTTLATDAKGKHVKSCSNACRMAEESKKASHLHSQ